MGRKSPVITRDRLEVGRVADVFQGLLPGEEEKEEEREGSVSSGKVFDMG